MPTLYEGLTQAFTDPMMGVAAGLLGGAAPGGSLGQGLQQGLILSQQMQMNNARQDMATRQLTQRIEEQRWARQKFQQQMETERLEREQAQRRLGLDITREQRLAGVDQRPSAVQTFEYYQGLDPKEQETFQTVQRASQWKDVGTGYVNPVTGDFVDKQTEQAAIQQATGEQAGKRIAGFQDKMSVAQSMLSGIERTRQQLGRLAGTVGTDTTGISSWLANIPGTDARSWRNIKDTVQSQLGYRTLMDLKQASSTGATGFGALSERELDLLISQYAKLDQADSPASIKQAIADIDRSLSGMDERLRGKMAREQTFYENQMNRVEPSLREPVPELPERQLQPPPGFGVPIP